MPDVGAWAKLAAYVVCTGLGLELAHRAYWATNSYVLNGKLRPAFRGIASAVSASFPLISVLLITGVFCAFVDRQSIFSLGLQLGSSAAVMFMSGAVIAFVSIAMLFVGCCRVGIFQVERLGLASDKIPAFFGTASDFLLSSLFEEVMVRGYIFAVLLNAWGGAAAVVGSAVIFSGLHVIKHPRIPFIYTLNAFLFGIITGQARLVTGSLWAPIGLHFGWNLAMGPVFGMPTSGKIYDSGILCCAVDGPEWLTGGLYSPDAGVLGSITLVVATMVLMVFVPIY